MKSNLLLVILVTGAILTGVLAVRHALKISVAINQPTVATAVRVSVSDVLRPHGNINDKHWLHFTQIGTLTNHATDSNGQERLTEWKIKLSAEQSLTRYDKTMLDVEQRFLFSSEKMVRTTLAAGIETNVTVLSEVEAYPFRFQAASVYLLFIVKRISDPDAEVLDLGSTPKGHLFQVNTIRGTWYFYTNSSHLIDRVEVDDLSITYSDFRSVEGLQLPFYLQVREGDTLKYEARIDALDLNPAFPSDFFKGDLK